MKKKIFQITLFIFVMTTTTISPAASPEMLKKLYSAYIGNRMDIWETTLAEIKNRGASATDYQSMYQLSVSYYGYIAYLIGTDQKPKARIYLDQAFTLLDKMENLRPDNSAVHSLEAAFLAYRIALDTYKAVYLGPKSLYHIERAIELDNRNPLAWLQKANALYYMPEVMGGSKTEALKYYRMAIDLMESEPAQLQHNWLYLNMLTIMAMGYANTGNVDLAQKTYEKILACEPDYQWVRDELYPAVIALSKQKKP